MINLSKIAKQQLLPLLKFSGFEFRLRKMYQIELGIKPHLTIHSMGPLQALANLRFAIAHFTANQPPLAKAP